MAACLRLVFVIVAVASVIATASAECDGLATTMADAAAQGDAIAPVLKKQWADKVALLQQRLAALRSSVSIPEKVKAVVLAALTQVEDQIVASLKAFAKKQNVEIIQVVKNYNDLLRQRLETPSTDEATIHEILEQSRPVVYAWESKLSKLHRDARQDLTDVMSELISRQTDESTKNAVVNVSNEYVDAFAAEEATDKSLLTGEQYELFQKSYQATETALLQLLECAKSQSG